MEPQHGHVWVQKQRGTNGGSGGGSAGRGEDDDSCWISDKACIWKNVMDNAKRIK